MLYVPAEPQHKWLSGTSFTTNPFLESILSELALFSVRVAANSGVIGDDNVARCCAGLRSMPLTYS